MLPLVVFVKIGLYAAMGISIVAALGAILCRNLFHAALCFVIVLLGIASVFLAVHAEFLAVVQILVYVGAIMTLVIFAIMMTSQITGKDVKQHNQLGLPVLVGGIAFFVVLMKLIFKTDWVIQEKTLAANLSLSELGFHVMDTYVFPFEVIAVLLTAALIGSIVITRNEKKQ